MLEWLARRGKRISVEGRKTDQINDLGELPDTEVTKDNFENFIYILGHMILLFFYKSQYFISLGEIRKKSTIKRLHTLLFIPSKGCNKNQ